MIFSDCDSVDVMACDSNVPNQDSESARKREVDAPFEPFGNEPSPVFKCYLHHAIIMIC